MKAVSKVSRSLTGADAAVCDGGAGKRTPIDDDGLHLLVELQRAFYTTRDYDDLLIVSKFNRWFCNWFCKAIDFLMDFQSFFILRICFLHSLLEIFRASIYISKMVF